MKVRAVQQFSTEQTKMRPAEDRQQQRTTDHVEEWRETTITSPMCGKFCTSISAKLPVPLHSPVFNKHKSLQRYGDIDYRCRGVVQSGEFDLDDITSMESTPFCSVSVNDNYERTRWQQARKYRPFFWKKTGSSIISETNERAEANSPVKPALIFSTTGMLVRIATVFHPQTEVAPSQPEPEITTTTSTVITAVLSALYRPGRSKPPRKTKQQGPEGDHQHCKCPLS